MSHANVWVGKAWGNGEWENSRTPATPTSSRFVHRCGILQCDAQDNPPFKVLYSRSRAWIPGFQAHPRLQASGTAGSLPDEQPLKRDSCDEEFKADSKLSDYEVCRCSNAFALIWRPPKTAPHSLSQLQYLPTLPISP